jgi:glycerol uptake facilitator-like aquaporin
MSVKSFFVYLAGQFLGAFIAAVLVYFSYFDALHNSNFEFHSIDTASVFTTYPYPYLSILNGLYVQTIATFLFIIMYLTLTDERNKVLHWSVVALLMGLCLTIIGTSFGYNTAFALNPARDFSPRLFILIAGWGGLSFSAYNYSFWIPLVAPMLGSFFATVFYTIFIANSK